MAGIFVGSTPITSMGSAIAEVYVGAVKVWPTSNVLYESWYGIKAANVNAQGSNPSLYYSSTPGASVVFQSSNGYIVINWAAAFTAYAAQGAGGDIISDDARIVVMGGVAAGQPSAALNLKRYSGTAGGNGRASIRWLTPVAEDDEVPESYARFNGVSGATLWALEPGWSCVRISSGGGSTTYDVTAPRALAAAVAWGSCNTSAISTTSRPATSITNINVAAGTFRARHSAGGDRDFSVGALLSGS